GRSCSAGVALRAIPTSSTSPRDRTTRTTDCLEASRSRAGAVSRTNGGAAAVGARRLRPAARSRRSKKRRSGSCRARPKARSFAGYVDRDRARSTISRPTGRAVVGSAAPRGFPERPPRAIVPALTRGGSHEPQRRDPPVCQDPAERRAVDGQGRRAREGQVVRGRRARAGPPGAGSVPVRPPGAGRLRPGQVRGRIPRRQAAAVPPGHGADVRRAPAADPEVPRLPRDRPGEGPGRRRGAEGGPALARREVAPWRRLPGAPRAAELLLPCDDGVRDPPPQRRRPRQDGLHRLDSGEGGLRASERLEALVGRARGSGGDAAGRLLERRRYRRKYFTGYVESRARHSTIQWDQARAAEASTQGVSDEQTAGTGWHAEGRFRPRVGRKARTVGRQWSPLWGLGDLPSHGIAGRPESAVRVAG